MTKAHDPGDRPWCSPLRVLTAVAVVCVCCVAVQDARASDAKPNATMQSVSQAKKLMRQVFAGHEHTFYCDCAYSSTTVELQSCGYQPPKTSKRARQLEWEYVVPADAF